MIIKTVLLAIIGVLAAAAVCIGLVLRTQIATVRSVEKVAEGLYQLTYYGDYKLDDLLDSGVGSIKELEQWLSRNIYFGYPVSGNESYYGCSTFRSVTEDGKRLMGRNYDYPKTDGLVVYTAPKGGYASYAMADLNIMGVDSKQGKSADSLLGKIFMLAAPFTITEGMNEKGLGVAILELELDEIHQDNGNPDVLLFIAVRMILDKCADAEEAVSMLSRYDIHSCFGYSYHLFIADASGKSVVVEWVDGQMKVMDTPFCTNFQLSEGRDHRKGIGHDRYELMEKTWKEKNGVIGQDEAMELLSAVSIEWNGEWDTEWSCVYNLTDFTVDVCVDRQYDTVYSFERKSFE